MYLVDCFEESLAEQNQVGLFEQLLPEWLEKRTSVAKAVKRRPFYGTDESVPFVRQSLPQALRVSENFMGCPNWTA